MVSARGIQRSATHDDRGASRSPRGRSHATTCTRSGFRTPRKLRPHIACPGRRGTGLVGVLSEVPASAGHGFSPPAVHCEPQAPPDLLEGDGLARPAVDIEELGVLHGELVARRRWPAPRGRLCIYYFQLQKSWPISRNLPKGVTYATSYSRNFKAVTT